MNARERVFTACALGGGLGAFLAHQVFYPSGWSLLLGFLVGGLVSYLTYDFKEVVAAIPQAWSKTVYAIHVYLPGLVVVVILASNVLVVASVGTFNLSKETTDLTRMLLGLTLMAGLITNLLRMIMLEGTSKELKSSRETAVYVLKWFNPFANIFIGVPYLIFAAFKGIILFGPRFVRNVFVLIHSELRLLCLFDGGLGAVAGALVVGTLAGTLVGALAGGIFGVLNFEIVSKRLLKLVPSR